MLDSIEGKNKKHSS
jgi:hypothetical protein